MRTQEAIYHRNFTAAEASAYLRLSRSSIYKLISAGQLRPIKIGRRTLFTREELDRLIDASRTA